MSDELKPAVQVDIDRDKIKRAVKEALDDKAIEDLGKQMHDLSTQMAEGFTKVHTRQDIANGRVGKLENRADLNENDIKDLKLAETAPTFWQRNQDKIVWGVIAVGLMLFYFLLTHAGFPDFLG